MGMTLDLLFLDRPAGRIVATSTVGRHGLFRQ